MPRCRGWRRGGEVSDDISRAATDPGPPPVTGWTGDEPTVFPTSGTTMRAPLRVRRSARAPGQPTVHSRVQGYGIWRHSHGNQYVETARPDARRVPCLRPRPREGRHETRTARWAVAHHLRKALANSATRSLTTCYWAERTASGDPHAPASSVETPTTRWTRACGSLADGSCPPQSPCMYEECTSASGRLALFAPDLTTTTPLQPPMPQHPHYRSSQRNDPSPRRHTATRTTPRPFPRYYISANAFVTPNARCPARNTTTVDCNQWIPVWLLVITSTLK